MYYVGKKSDTCKLNFTDSTDMFQDDIAAHLLKADGTAFRFFQGALLPGGGVNFNVCPHPPADYGLTSRSYICKPSEKSLLKMDRIFS